MVEMDVFVHLHNIDISDILLRLFYCENCTAHVISNSSVEWCTASCVRP